MSLSCNDARQLDLVQYLAELGYHPKRVFGPNHWYLSPLREEDTPSFKVDQKKNLWFDHGTGQGGNLVDFGIAFHKCSVREFLQILGNRSISPPKLKTAETVVKPDFSPIVIRSVKPIESPYLITYLAQREIPLWLAQKHCNQVDFELHGKAITTLGFRNRSGGYELRNPTYKGSSHPKDLSFVDNGLKGVAVFEGFFSFLSYLKITNQSSALTNFLVLNSLSFLEKARTILDDHARIDLFLDNDKAGRETTLKALQWGPKYQDRSYEYRFHKDWNDRLLGILQSPRQTLGQRRHR